ncbi:mucin-5AC-like isoform X2 [Gigantopelta aegis]|nr:mucin-5AC-like isoform X2 [Gigantopelta aegis]
MTQVVSVITLLLLVLPLTVGDECTALPVRSTTQLVLMKPFKGKGSTVLKYLKPPLQNSQEACGRKCCSVTEEQCILGIFKKDATPSEPNCFLYVCAANNKCRIQRYTNVAMATLADNVMLEFVDDHPVLRSRVRRDAPTNATAPNPVTESNTSVPKIQQTDANSTLTNQTDTVTTPILKADTNVTIPATTQQAAQTGNSSEKQSSPVKETNITSGQGQIITTTPVQQNAGGTASELHNSTSATSKNTTSAIANSTSQTAPQTDALGTTQPPIPNTNASEKAPPVTQAGVTQSNGQTNKTESVTNQQAPISSQGTNITVTPQATTMTNSTTGPDTNATINATVNGTDVPATKRPPPPSSSSSSSSTTTTAATTPTAIISNTTTPATITSNTTQTTTTRQVNNTVMKTATFVNTSPQVTTKSMQTTTTTLPSNRTILYNTTTIPPRTDSPVTTAVEANTTVPSDALTTAGIHNSTGPSVNSTQGLQNVTEQSMSSTSGPGEAPVSDVTGSLNFSVSYPPSSSTDGVLLTLIPGDYLSSQPMVTTTANSTLMDSNSTMMSTTSLDKRLVAVLIGALSLGMIFFVAVIALVSRRVYESWQRRHYSRIDYLVNGMYN